VEVKAKAGVSAGAMKQAIEKDSSANALKDEGTLRFEWYMTDDSSMGMLVEVFTSSKNAMKRLMDDRGEAGLAATLKHTFEIVHFRVMGPSSKELQNEVKHQYKGVTLTFEDYEAGFIRTLAA